MRKSASPRHLAAAHSVTFRLFRRLQTRHGGNRAAGTPGYDRSAEYVANQLRNAGYKVRLEEFTFPFFDERSPPLLVAGPTHPSPYTPPSDALRTLRNSGSGEVTARLQGIDLNLNEDRLLPSTSGCEREDFAGFVPGHVALIRRGTCPFQLKVEYAQAAGAAGVIIMNQGIEGQTGAFAGHLSTPATIPVLGVSTEVGLRLAAATQEANGSEVHLKIEAETGTRSTRNVIAERDTMSGSFVVVGAHLDSVSEGPGMNDNASGSAAVLESALRLAEEPAAGMPIRFAFWGAEERGLLGSRHHLSILPEEERRRIGLYINLDMVGSPNFGRFIQYTAESSIRACGEHRGAPQPLFRTAWPSRGGADQALPGVRFGRCFLCCQRHPNRQPVYRSWWDQERGASPAVRWDCRTAVRPLLSQSLRYGGQHRWAGAGADHRRTDRCIE